MKISVVIPLFNKQNQISRSFQSILAQTYSCSEIIIVDDGSTDNSYEVANSFKDPRLRLFQQENRGVSAARNRGIDLAKNQWVAFLDADDEWKPDFLNSINELHNDYPRCGLYATYYAIYRSSGKRIETWFRYYPENWSGIIEDYFLLRCYGYPFNSSSLVVRKDILNQAGNFPVGVQYGEDSVTWIKMSLITDIGYLNSPKSIYHFDHLNSLSFSNQNTQKMWVIDLVKEMIEKNQIPDERKESATKLISNFKLMEVDRLLRNGHRNDAYKLLSTIKISRFFYNKWIRLFLRTLLPSCLIGFYIRITRVIKK